MDSIAFEHSNQPSNPIKGEELFDQLNNYQFLMKDFVPWN
jgi:hypothetical protein